VLDTTAGFGDKLGLAYALNSVGNVAHIQGDYAQATARYQESAILFRELENTAYRPDQSHQVLPAKAAPTSRCHSSRDKGTSRDRLLSRCVTLEQMCGQRDNMRAIRRCQFASYYVSCLRLRRRIGPAHWPLSQASERDSIDRKGEQNSATAGKVVCSSGACFALALGKGRPDEPKLCCSVTMINAPDGLSAIAETLSAEAR